MVRAPQCRSGFLTTSPGFHEPAAWGWEGLGREAIRQSGGVPLLSRDRPWELTGRSPRVLSPRDSPARILQWAAISFSRASARRRGGTRVSRVGSLVFDP